MHENRFAQLVTDHQVQQFEALYGIRNALKRIVRSINEGHWSDCAEAFKAARALASEAEEALHSPVFNAAYKQRRAMQQQENAGAAVPPVAVVRPGDDIPF